MKIVSRSEWGARPPTSQLSTIAYEIFLHHSVGYGQGGESYMRQMQNQHMDVEGWSDIAYNFAIDPADLRVFEGRGWGVRPGSQQSYNANTWSVVIMGNFAQKIPSAALLQRIADLVKYGQELGYLPASAVLQGHKDAPGQSTTCPGAKLYAQLGAINNLIEEDVMTDAQYNAILAAINGVPLQTWAIKVNGSAATDPSQNQILIRILAAVGDIQNVTTAELQAIADVVADEIAARGAE